MTLPEGIDLEITNDCVRINGVEVAASDTPIEISPISYKSYLQATITLFVKSLKVEAASTAVDYQ